MSDLDNFFAGVTSLTYASMVEEGGYPYTRGCWGLFLFSHGICRITYYSLTPFFLRNVLKPLSGDGPLIRVKDKPVYTPFQC